MNSLGKTEEHILSEMLMEKGLIMDNIQMVIDERLTGLCGFSSILKLCRNVIQWTIVELKKRISLCQIEEGEGITAGCTVHNISSVIYYMTVLYPLQYEQ